jgi:lactoylglutathione lyase
VAQISYYVSDLGKARSYYEGFLGFREAFSLKTEDGSNATFVKINDHQFVELIAEPPKNHGSLYGIAFETDDARAMRAYLASIGVKVPDAVGKDVAGDLSFEITDPSGFTIQIVQYQPGSRTMQTKGKFMPDSRISTHIDHVGLLMADRDEAAKFYGDSFGFVREGDGTKMKIGDSADRFELGFERKPATIDRYHVKDHICLSIPDVPAVTAMLSAKPDAKGFRAIENHQLGNGKHVAELYDLDGNRVELMEPPGAAALAQTSSGPQPASAVNLSVSACAGLPPGKHRNLERMTDLFGLTCEQELKIEPQLHNEESVSKPLLRFDAFSSEEKQVVMVKIKLAARRQIRTLLTPDQQKKMDEEIESVAKGGGKAGGGKKSQGTEVEVNAFDNEEQLSQAINNYSALTPDEKTEMMLQVKTAARKNAGSQLTGEQLSKLDSDIRELSSTKKM